MEKGVGLAWLMGLTENLSPTIGRSPDISNLYVRLSNETKLGENTGDIQTVRMLTWKSKWERKTAGSFRRGGVNMGFSGPDRGSRSRLESVGVGLTHVPEGHESRPRGLGETPCDASKIVSANTSCRNPGPYKGNPRRPEKFVSIRNSNQDLLGLI